MVVWDIQPPALWTKADGTPFWSADVTALFLMLYAREVIPMSFRTRLAMELIDPAVNRTHGDVSETREGVSLLNVKWRSWIVLLKTFGHISAMLMLDSISVSLA